ncbi:hypothetical protein H0H93_007566 [Arthromyces matolae]|nr:hypothetical protein H0H93_007566 [Arthromyces matolae]
MPKVTSNGLRTPSKPYTRPPQRHATTLADPDTTKDAEIARIRSQLYTDIEGMNKGESLKHIQGLIFPLVDGLNNQPAFPHASNRYDHVGKPFRSYGIHKLRHLAWDKQDVGLWMRKVCQGGNYTIQRGQPPPPEEFPLTLQVLLQIRQEIHLTKGQAFRAENRTSRKSPSLPIPSSPILVTSSSVPSSPVQSSSSIPTPPRFPAPFPLGDAHKKDYTKALTLRIRKNRKYEELIVLAREEDGFLHLNDYKLQLGKLGIEVNDPLTLWVGIDWCYPDFSWTTPLDVQPGTTLDIDADE